MLTCATVDTDTDLIGADKERRTLNVMQAHLKRFSALYVEGGRQQQEQKQPSWRHCKCFQTVNTQKGLIATVQMLCKA